MTLVRSPSGASATCSECGTVYDLHGVSSDELPPVGDGCDVCAPPRCLTCGRLLNQPDDPKSLDCGGDCRGCIDEIERG